MSYTIWIEGLDIAESRLGCSLPNLPKGFTHFRTLFFHGEADIEGSDNATHSNPHTFEVVRDGLITSIKFSLVNRGQAITSECESFNEAILYVGDMRVGSAALANAQAMTTSGIAPCALSYERMDSNLFIPIGEGQVIKAFHGYDGNQAAYTQRPAYHIQVYIVEK